VQSGGKTQITLKEEFSLPELQLPSLGEYSLVFMQNIAHWKLRGCNSRLLASYLHQNTHILSEAGKNIKVTNVFILYQPRN
jgi:hypothetical protein